MAYDDVTETVQVVHAAEERYSSFLLGIAAAAIAFAVQRTGDTNLSASQILLAVSVGLWGYSFWCGCQRTERVAAMQFAMMGIVVALQKFAVNQTPENEAEIGAAKVKMKEAFVSGSRLLRRQFNCLVAGGLTFVLWHILEMYLRTYAGPVSANKTGLAYV